MNDYILCDNPSRLNYALESLKSSRRIVLDCEGDDLGREGGRLSLINFRTFAPSPQTFLVDAVLLGDLTLRPLFNLLESHVPTKIVFDGRMDFSELYHGHHITLTGVQDLQLADINSRRMRGENQDKQLRRLSPYLRRTEVFGQRNSYLQIQQLSGLNRCLEEHGVVQFKKRSLSHDLWLKRPLPKEYLRYAASDVYAIGLLFEHFKETNYIDPYYDLSDKSQRYITMWQDGRPRSGDAFKSHALLPLGILDNPPYGQDVKPCKSCHRHLSSQCFSTGWGKKPRQCWVCRALDVNGRG